MSELEKWVNVEEGMTNVEDHEYPDYDRWHPASDVDKQWDELVEWLGKRYKFYDWRGGTEGQYKCSVITEVKDKISQIRRTG